jgi:hypothetical protein
VPVLPITRGPPERPALAVEIPADVNTGCSFANACCWGFARNGTNSSGLAPICVGCRKPPTLPLPPARSARIVRDHLRVFFGGCQFLNGRRRCGIGASRSAPANREVRSAPVDVRPAGAGDALATARAGPLHAKSGQLATSPDLPGRPNVPLAKVQREVD